MKIGNYIGLVVLHAALSLGLLLVLNVWAVGQLDAGGAEPGPVLRGAALALRYALLQPLAHWLLGALEIGWWTWPGLAATAIVVVANSALQVALLALIWSRARALRRADA